MKGFFYLMRIISGFLKGRKINPPHLQDKTRPTTDMAKEGLFNTISNFVDFEGIRVLDLFCGSGNIGIEFLSRGAEWVVFLDHHKGCTQFIHEKLTEFELLGQSKIITQKFQSFHQSYHGPAFDLIFLDPPYDFSSYQKFPTLFLEARWLNAEGYLIIEHDHRNNFEKHSNFVMTKKYGQSQFSFLKPRYS